MAARGFLELCMKNRLPSAVFQDNLRAIPWTDKVQGLNHVKHVGIRYHFVRRSVEKREPKVIYTTALENKADLLTKVLARELHDVHHWFLEVDYSVRSVVEVVCGIQWLQWIMFRPTKCPYADVAWHLKTVRHFLQHYLCVAKISKHVVDCMAQSLIKHLL